MYKILIPEDIDPSGKDYLREQGYELRVGVPTDRETRGMFNYAAMGIHEVLRRDIPTWAANRPVRPRINPRVKEGKRLGSEN
jgi:hypothetical protein